MFPVSLNRLPDPIRIRLVNQCDYFELHRHNYLEFMYVLEGEGEELVNGTIRRLVPGCFSLILPCQLHQIRLVPGKNLRFYCVAVQLNLLFDGLGIPGRVRDLLLDPAQSTQGLFYFQSLEIKGILDRMHQDYLAQEEWWQAMMSARLVEIFIHLSRECQGVQFASPRAEKLPARSEDPLWKIVYHLYRNHDRHLDAAKLEEHFNLSIRQIRSLFQKKLGISLQEFILDLRLSNVRSMLENSDINITDIAIGAGFESYRTFVRVFEKQYAITPRDYRKQIHSQRLGSVG